MSLLSHFLYVFLTSSVAYRREYCLSSQTTADPKMTYLIWTANASGVQSAQDTFIYDENYKIARQNIAWTKTPCVKAAPCPSTATAYSFNGYGAV